MMITSESRIAQILDGVAGRRIAIIGDVMLDRYFRGYVSRISPEAPVPIVEIEDESEHPGGAANVAYNLVELGATPLLFGVIGDDRSGKQLRDLLGSLGIADDALIVDSERPTTVKTRVIAASQHIVRVDRERKHGIGADVLARLTGLLEEKISTLDAVVLQDYNKGVITRELIPLAVDIATRQGVPVFVDPKFENFYEYRGVTVFKPNRKEAEDALQRSLGTDETRREGVGELLHRLSCDYVVLTLGAEGMMLASADEEPIVVPTRALQVADVSGAGDTVIAALTAAQVAGATMVEAVHIANCAAGVVCEQIGTVPITATALRDTLINDFRKGVEA